MVSLLIAGRIFSKTSVIAHEGTHKKTTPASLTIWLKSFLVCDLAESLSQRSTTFLLLRIPPRAVPISPAPIIPMFRINLDQNYQYNIRKSLFLRRLIELWVILN